MCENDTLTACAWVAPHNKLKEIYLKRTETSLHKKISKRNLADVGMAQCINALADKKYHAHSDMHGHIIQQPSLPTVCK